MAGIPLENEQKSAETIEDTGIPEYNNNEKNVTVAPYYSTPVTNENYAEVKASADGAFRTKAQSLAESMGLSISEIRDNVGGYTFSEGENSGKSVKEISYTVALQNATDEQADLYAALLSDLGYEVQETGISSKYIAANEADDNSSLEIEIPIRPIGGDVETLPQRLAAAGITDFTIDNGKNVIRVFASANLSSEDISIQAHSIVSAIGGQFDGTRPAYNYSFSKAQFLDSGARESIYRGWLAKTDLQSGQGGSALRADVEQALSAVTAFRQGKVTERSAGTGLGAANAGFVSPETAAVDAKYQADTEKYGILHSGADTLTEKDWDRTLADRTAEVKSGKVSKDNAAASVEALPKNKLRSGRIIPPRPF